MAFYQSAPPTIAIRDGRRGRPPAPGAQLTGGLPPRLKLRT